MRYDVFCHSIEQGQEMEVRYIAKASRRMDLETAATGKTGDGC